MTLKYNMSLEQNVFFAKRNIVDYIWKSANLEGIAVTFPDTEAIYNGINVSNMRVSDIVAINNLKHAWGFVFDKIEFPVNFDYLCKLNQIVGSNLIYQAGKIREMSVSMGGTTWRPNMPKKEEIEKDLIKIHKITDNTDKAVTMMLYLMRKQIFYDGNKRISMLAANQTLIQNGEGIIAIPIDKQRDFSELLIQFYETNDMEKIKTFVCEYCIDGMEAEHCINERKTLEQQLKEAKQITDKIPEQKEEVRTQNIEFIK